VSKRELLSLSEAAWLHHEALQTVLIVLNENGETRVAGGAVRNALLGVPVADIDLATTLLPKEVIQKAKHAGFGVHPTGIEHGTVTITHCGAAFEVTTLRRDVETNGRHAVVAFTKDWAEDAARRDFTINAMYCDRMGKLFDFTDGYSDIRKRKVRFVGRASQRIGEDHLRILRFFRFHAWYGRGALDAAGLKACVRLKARLRDLSAERVRQELLKLLAAPNALAIVKVMAATNVLKIILPHTEDWRAFGRLPADAILQLFVLAKDPLSLKARLRLSNAEAQRLQALFTAPKISPKMSANEQRRVLYYVGAQVWRDIVLLSKARSRGADAEWDDVLTLAERWSVPVLPVKGEDLIAARFSPGPKLGSVLAALEDWWVASDFKPSKEELLGRLGRYRD
jgi:poly(A) polymerase